MKHQPEPKIAVVVPTVRPESYQTFLEGWEHLFDKHQVLLIAVLDGEIPILKSVQYHGQGLGQPKGPPSSIEDVMGEDSADLIFNKNDGVRNLGFAYVAKYTDCDIVITLDDDVLPVGDTIQDHIDALSKSYPVSWMNTSMTTYMRGFPYDIRDEAECVFSHGVWTGVADFDASTQLVLGNHVQEFFRGPIPKGILAPICVMNVSFKRRMLPYYYQAPAYGCYQRFSDIWAGIEIKKEIDYQDLALVTGYATVQHNRASNAFVNLIKESVGVGMNEKYWREEVQGHDEYMSQYKTNRERWRMWMLSNFKSTAQYLKETTNK